MALLLYYLHVPLSEEQGGYRMTKAENAAIEKLKSIIVEKGKEYLYKEPQSVYSKLIKEKNIDSSTAGVVGYALLTGIGKKSTDSLEEDVSKLGLKKTLSSSLFLILSSVFSPSFSSDLEDMKKKAIDEFCDMEWEFEISGDSEWRAKNGYRMRCRYRYTMLVTVTDRKQVEEDIPRLMKGKDAYTAEEIAGKYQDELEDEVSGDFDDFCTGDDYYEPYVEGYDGESGDGVISDYLEKHGLEADDLVYWSDTDDDY